MSAVHPAALTSELIRLDGIFVHRDDRDILKNIDFALHQNEIVTLIGPNGARKVDFN